MSQLKGSVISVKEARKLMGQSVEKITDGDLEDLIRQQEQVIRFIFRLHNVHKKGMVK